jgi:predicted AlkP superfamily phosphohydrolase/phosphomutase
VTRARTTALVLLAVLWAATPREAGAWGFHAHRLINRRAVETLPQPLRAFFARNADFVSEHAVDPDLWRASHPEEGPNHFLDLDAFGSAPPFDIPRDEAAHLAGRGRDAIQKGRVPWRIGEVYRELVAAFRAGDGAAILERAAVLGHYVGDSHVPLHAAVNYDGQLTGQAGLHDRWESRLVERFQLQIAQGLKPAPAARINDPVAFAFETLQASFRNVDGVLASDRACAGPKDLAETPEDDRYDDAYYSRFYEREGARVLQRLSASIQALGGLWLSAWEDAGRPPLPAYRAGAVRRAHRGVLLSLDGAPAALLDDAIARGLTPHLAKLKDDGASASGLVPAFPVKTAAGHAALWTGTWAEGNGITGNDMTAPGAPITSKTSGFESKWLRAEPLWVSAARQDIRTTVVVVPQTFPFTPYVEERRFGGSFGRELTLVDGYRNERAAEAVYGWDDLQVRPASGWPEGHPARTGAAWEFHIAVGAETIEGLLYDDPADPVAGLDSAYLAARKDDGHGIVLKPQPALGADASAFRSLTVKVEGGQAGLFFRLFALSPGGKSLILYRSAAALLRASKPRVEAAALEATGGFVGNGAYRPYTHGDFGPPLPQGGDGTAEHRYLETAALAVRQLTRLLEFAFDRTPGELMIGYLPFPDEGLHQWLGFVDPTLPGHDAALAARVQPFLDEIWRLADGYVGAAMAKAGGDSVLAVASDHGMTSTRRALRPNVALARAGLLFASGREVDLRRTRVLCPRSDGALLVNTTARGGIVPPEEEERVRGEAASTLRALRDPASGEPLVLDVLDVARDGHAHGIGGPTAADLYLRVAPGLSISADLEGALVEDMLPKGEHFQDPESRPLQGIFLVSGPGVAHGGALDVVRQIDVAPTLAALLGLEPPALATGRVVPAAIAPHAQ